MSWANQDVATFRWPGPSLDPVTIAGSSRCKSIESGIELGYLRWYSRYSPKVFSLSHLGHLFGPYFMGSQRFQPEISCLRPVFDALNLCLWADCNGTLEGHGCALWSVWKSGRSRRSVFYGMVWLKGLPFANLPCFFYQAGLLLNCWWKHSWSYTSVRNHAGLTENQTIQATISNHLKTFLMWKHDVFNYSIAHGAWGFQF